MDGAASLPASAEEESSGSAVDLEPRCPAAPAMIVPEESKEEEEERYVDLLVRVSLQLLRKGFAPEVRRQGLKLMLHLLRFRWDELCVEKWSVFSDVADLKGGSCGTTNILPSKSAIAALMAEVILSGGISLLNDLLPSIIFLSKRGPTEAELAAFILKSISDFRIFCKVDLEFLSGLDEVLPNIMLTLSSLLEKHGGAVLLKHPDQLVVSSKKHALTVAACLLAASAYAEWVPVFHLAKYGLIERCKFFLNFSNLHVLALRFFKVICQRPICATEDYDAAMSLVFWTLMSISKDSLNKSESHSSVLDESQLDFAGQICECLVALGSFNMQFIIRDANRATHFFQQMLEYYQHSKFALHIGCLQFWLMVLTELSKEKRVAPDPGVVASAVNPASVTNSTEKGDNGSLVIVTDDICDGIMDISLKRILKKSAATSPELLELWNDELHGKNGFIQYRSTLLDLIRLISYERPIIAASRAVQRINYKIVGASAVSKYPEDFEGVQLGLETVVSAIFNDAAKIILDTEFPLQRIYKIFEGLLVQLLSLNWTEPRLMVILGHYLNTLCPFLRHFPDAVAMVVTKLIKLLSSINADCHDPLKAQYAKLQICSCVIHMCQAVDGTYLPSDMKGLFAVSHITEEDVLAFVALNGTDYSVEQKQVGGEGNQDGDATTTPSTSSSYVTLRQHPWALNVEGLSVALSDFHDLPTTQASFGSCSDPSFPESNGIACSLKRKKLDHILILSPRLYYTSFPLHGSVPISWLGLGTKSQNRNEGMSLNLSPQYQIGTENHSRSSLAHSSSPSLSLSKQRHQLHANGKPRTHVSPLTQVGESQPINIFDDCGQGTNQDQNTVQGIVTCDYEGSTESVDEAKWGVVGTMSCHQEKGHLFLVEHNILSKAFVIVASFPRIQDMEHLLTDILNILNKIWTQPDWEDKYMHYTYKLSGLFSNDQFRRTVRSLVNSFEEELTCNIIVESGEPREGCSQASADYMYSYTISKLMLALILRILDCVQKLWKEQITYDLSGVAAEDISVILENGILFDVDEAKILQNAKTWSQGIRETGYNIIGLCASVEGAFYGLLDSSCIFNVLVDNLRPMDFYHVGKLIQLAFIPLVRCCPHECWDKWMFELLEPVFSYCEEIFYYAWFTFLHEGRAKVPAYFGNLDGPEEIIKEFEKELLLKFTRSVSGLLGVIASERLNTGLSLYHSGTKHSMKADFQDLKTISSSSLIGYLLLHNCLGRLNMYLFGCLVDCQAAEKALPFCYALIRLSIATNHERLNQFILNEMLPTTILLIGADPPSVISQLSSSLNPTTREDVIHLCQEIYGVYIDNKVMVGEGADRKNMLGRFDDWLKKELEDLRKRAPSVAPETFPEYVEWKWEFNEEFERYLPVYMNILEEVDKMDDCLKDNCMDNEILLEKLKPEFRSRYGINSYAHPYLQTMSRMLQRKVSAEYCRSRTKWISQILIKLITLKPYIKRTDSRDRIFERLQEICEPQTDLFQCNPASAIDIFRGSILFYWEPQFHPLIREGQMELLKTIARQLVLAEESVLFEALEPHPGDFLEHLQPYAWMYIKRKKEESGYYRIEEQVRLHEQFDEYLASGTLDHYMNEFSCSKDEFVHEVVVSDFENTSFATLNHDLIKLSFERRAKIVEWEHQVSSYSQCLTSLLKNDEMKDELGHLMNVLNAEGFFSVDDDSMDWDNKLFSDLVDKFNKVVFSGQCIDKCLVIRGIMDYNKILQMKDVDWQDAFRMVVSNTIYLWKENLRQFWVTTRHYKHDYYATLAQPLQKVFLNGVPKPKYG